MFWAELDPKPSEVQWNNEFLNCGNIKIHHDFGMNFIHFFIPTLVTAIRRAHKQTVGVSVNMNYETSESAFSPKVFPEKVQITHCQSSTVSSSSLSVSFPRVINRNLANVSQENTTSEFWEKKKWKGQVCILARQLCERKDPSTAVGSFAIKLLFFRNLRSEYSRNKSNTWPLRLPRPLPSKQKRYSPLDLFYGSKSSTFNTIRNFVFTRTFGRYLLHGCHHLPYDVVSHRCFYLQIKWEIHSVQLGLSHENQLCLTQKHRGNPFVPRTCIGFPSTFSWWKQDFPSRFLSWQLNFVTQIETEFELRYFWSNLVKITVPGS